MKKRKLKMLKAVSFLKLFQLNFDHPDTLTVVTKLSDALQKA